MSKPQVSVVIPVYNEEAVLGQLFARLYPAMDALGVPYEIVFVNDGSRDRSVALLREQFQLRPEVTRVVLFNGNFGQHMAIMAGFEYSHGERIITIDADLQNPPEDIPKLLAAMDQGYDYVGSIRNKRKDSAWRHIASRCMNWLRERITRIKMTDQGCMMRAYSRPIIDAIKSSREVNTFIPALAYTYASNPTEVVVQHDERAAGESKYSLLKLIRLNFDLITGFSIAPLQWFSIIGMFVATLSAAAYVIVMVYRLATGHGLISLWDRDILNFFLNGMVLFGLGMVGEYVGRIYLQVRERPRFIVQAVLDESSVQQSLTEPRTELGTTPSTQPSQQAAQ
jgi:undecaprenyl-phosphate 4-deoxy-4-formamido-L-arabinose transferase